MCEILQQHEKVMNSSTPPPPHYVKLLQTCDIMNCFQCCTGTLFQIKLLIRSLISFRHVQLLIASACSLTSIYLMYIYITHKGSCNFVFSTLPFKTYTKSLIIILRKTKQLVLLHCLLLIYSEPVKQREEDTRSNTFILIWLPLLDKLSHLLFT